MESKQQRIEAESVRRPKAKLKKLFQTKYTHDELK